MLTSDKLKKIPNKFYSEEFDVNSWAILKKELTALLDMSINSADELANMLERYSELDFILGDEMARKYIEMTRFSDNTELEEKFNTFYAEIVTPSMPFDFKLKKKFYDSPFRKELPEFRWGHFNRLVTNDIEMFRDANVPLMRDERELANQYGAIIGKLSAEFDGEEKTYSQLGAYQKDPDRNKREAAWRIRLKLLAEKSSDLDILFDKLRDLRGQLAQNAGFSSYRDFEHQRKGRFSYTPADVEQFHASVEQKILPLLREFNMHRKETLCLDSVRPWDIGVDLDGKKLHPFKDTDELITRSIEAMHRV
ncbi:MAG: M3 family oligoendopeptidase, partial [Candidatus Cloacimonetes bacterium]|nr:M3 family oligoendopeptidase [Candidatus Cloacimonadota bacterium]